MTDQDASVRKEAAGVSALPDSQGPVAGDAVRDTSEPWLARALRAVFGGRAASAREDLESVLQSGESEAGFSPEERAMLRNILDMRERRVDDVMVPRADIVAVEHDITLAELIGLIETAGHSRLVVHGDTLDNPLGMVHIRDLLSYLASCATEPAREGLNLGAVDLSVALSATGIVRPLLFAPPSMPIIALLAKMQATRIHLALVIDEYGGTDGLVSIEDIVEQIVGEIEDEHDEDETPSVVPEADGSFLADARASLEDVTQTVGGVFDVGEIAEEVDTIGGYLITRAGRVPLAGECFQGPDGFAIEVLEADPRRVLRVRISRSAAEAGSTGPESVAGENPPEHTVGAESSLVGEVARSGSTSAGVVRSL